jgi:hypothetical protein
MFPYTLRLCRLDDSEKVFSVSLVAEVRFQKSLMENFVKFWDECSV